MKNKILDKIITFDEKMEKLIEKGRNNLSHMQEEIMANEKMFKQFKIWRQFIRDLENLYQDK